MLCHFYFYAELIIYFEIEFHFKYLQRTVVNILFELRYQHFFLQIWNTIRTNQLAQEMDQLRSALDEMKHRIGFEYFDDLEDFENSVSLCVF